MAEYILSASTVTPCSCTFVSPDLYFVFFEFSFKIF